MNSNQISRQLSNKVCPECGQPIEERIASFLNECDHCLSKTVE